MSRLLSFLRHTSVMRKKAHIPFLTIIKIPSKIYKVCLKIDMNAMILVSEEYLQMAFISSILLGQKCLDFKVFWSTCSAMRKKIYNPSLSIINIHQWSIQSGGHPRGWHWGMCPPPLMKKKLNFCPLNYTKNALNCGESSVSLRAKAYAPPFPKSWVCPWFDWIINWLHRVLNWLSFRVCHIINVSCNRWSGICHESEFL